jgi:DNA repair protein RadC
MRVWEAKLQYSLLALGDPRRIESPQDAVSYLSDAFAEDPTVEWFWVILLDQKHHPIGRKLVSQGTATSTLVHPREVFKAAIIAGATAVILGHNHPSGDPAPSSGDFQVTRMLRQAGDLLQIPVKDHVIVGQIEADPANLGFFSFNEAGHL